MSGIDGNLVQLDSTLIRILFAGDNRRAVLVQQCVDALDAYLCRP